MAVQQSVIKGMRAGCKNFIWASHSRAIAKANDDEGRVNGRPNGVRMARLSRVTVNHEVGKRLCGLRSDVSDEILLVTPDALCEPSTPADMPVSTDSLLLTDILECDGGSIGAMATCL